MEKRPIYFIILRAAQAFLGLIVLALAANFIHGASTDEQVLALVCGLFTIFIAVFGIISGRLQSLQTKVVLLAGMGADALLAILWLASMASNARLRSLLTAPVQCSAYYDNGDTVNSHYCITKRTNPNLVVGPFGRATIDAVAALSALECLLFIATLILTFLFMRRQNTTTTTHNKSMEGDVPMQPQPMQSNVTPGHQPYQAQGYQVPPNHAAAQHQYGVPATTTPQPVHQYQAPPQGYQVSPVHSPATPQGGYAPPAQPYQAPYHG